MIFNIKDIELTEDKYNQIINLYSNFNKIDKQKLTYIILKKTIESLNDNHKIFLYMENGKILGSITLLIEKKIIHNGGLAAHIEDFVVLKEHHNKGIGKKLLGYVLEISKKYNCYKCILDCNDLLESYYNQFDFTKKGLYMGLYF
tara:strand:+ start:634 stop:1068 length:435 start_codon:yes stop_codon:yes gene_type:complete